MNALFRIIKSHKVQLVAIILVMAYILFLFTKQYKSDIFLEKYPELMPVSSKIKSLATPVEVGLHINSFPEFSFNQNNFVMDAIVWFRFVKSTESLETIGRFTFNNSKLLADGELVHKSPPIIRVLDKDVVVCYHVQANFMSDINFRKFPMSDHRLNIFLQNKSVTAQEMVFVTDSKNLTFSENILIEHWMPEKVNASYGCYKAELRSGDKEEYITYPCASFSIDFRSVGARIPLSLYLPLFILFFIILISLVLNISDTNRLGLVSAGVPALVLFRFVIDGISPNVGYSTHIDIIYYLIVALSLAVLFLQTYFVLLVQKDEEPSEEEKGASKNRLDNINAVMFFLILIIFVAVLTYNYI